MEYDGLFDYEITYRDKSGELKEVTISATSSDMAERALMFTETAKEIVSVTRWESTRDHTSPYDLR